MRYKSYEIIIANGYEFEAITVKLRFSTDYIFIR